MRIALVIPSLGATSLTECVARVHRLDPAPSEVVAVLSGPGRGTALPRNVAAIRNDRRLGFAAAANAGITEVWQRSEAVALLNDDAFPDPGWLGVLAHFLEDTPEAAAVQGSIVDRDGGLVDGRGVTFSRWRLPTQVDRGRAAKPEPERPARRTAVSATAALYRSRALLDVALDPCRVFDPAFDSYHEDVDLGLRLARLGWASHWVPGARCRHLGSASGRRLGWRHPWWLLANPWRVIAGNLSLWSILATVPAAAWGELRAAARMTPHDPRALPAAGLVAAALPLLLAAGWRRPTPGRRLRHLPPESR